MSFNPTCLRMRLEQIYSRIKNPNKVPRSCEKLVDFVTETIDNTPRNEYFEVDYPTRKKHCWRYLDEKLEDSRFFIFELHFGKEGKNGKSKAFVIDEDLIVIPQVDDFPKNP